MYADVVCVRGPHIFLFICLCGNSTELDLRGSRVRSSAPSHACVSTRGRCREKDAVSASVSGFSLYFRHALTLQSLPVCFHVPNSIPHASPHHHHHRFCLCICPCSPLSLSLPLSRSCRKLLNAPPAGASVKQIVLDVKGVWLLRVIQL